MEPGSHQPCGGPLNLFDRAVEFNQHPAMVEVDAGFLDRRFDVEIPAKAPNPSLSDGFFSCDEREFDLRDHFQRRVYLGGGRNDV